MESNSPPSSSSTGQSSPMVHVVCGGYGPGVACEIYAIDTTTKDEDQTPEHAESLAALMPKPVCTFTTEEVPLLMGYFTVGRYIYMIGGERIIPNQRGSETVNEVFTYDTETCELCQQPPMHFPKNNAIVIGPSRIGPNSYYYTLGRRLSYHDFEVFVVVNDKPSSGVWKKLPQPPVPCFPKRYRSAIETEVYSIVAQTIIDDEQLILIATKSAGVFGYYIIGRVWKYIDASAILPFCFGAPFVSSIGLYFGFSPSSGDETGIVAFSAIRGLDLVLRKLLSGNFRQRCTRMPVLGIDPLFEDPVYSRTLVFLSPLRNGMLCFIRSCTDESSLNSSNQPRKLVAINVFRPQVMESDGIINAVDSFSRTYLLDESNGVKNVCACLSF